MEKRRGAVGRLAVAGVGAVAAVAAAVAVVTLPDRGGPEARPPAALRWQPRKEMVDTSGYGMVDSRSPEWGALAGLEEVARAWGGIVARLMPDLDRELASPRLTARVRMDVQLNRARLLNYEGRPREAYGALAEARAAAESEPPLAREWLYTVVYFQGVTALRRGETENCVMCRGESSCILPIGRGAVHQQPAGSRAAVGHFTEYLREFPDDLHVRWLLNLAHMTLGEHPQGVEPRFLVSLGRYESAEHGIGRFRDVGERAGVNRFNQSGGAILEDFDNDGLLDLFVTSNDPTQPAVLYRNRGDGTFEDRGKAAGLAGQLGGLYCVQGDYDNDGHMDVFVARGAWLRSPVRPSLLRNRGDGTFEDVTDKAGLAAPVNAITAAWADYDNDGHLDLFVCCERQANRLYRNKGDGTFEEVAERAGVAGLGQVGKGCAWLDYDNDGYPDLFVNHLNGRPRFYRNDGRGAFTDVTGRVGVTGPQYGFSCWAWDYDNDGYLDLFATSYQFTLEDVVRGVLGEPAAAFPGKLWRNRWGKEFEDVTREAGLEQAFATMGSNFGDFDNDGYLDFYLGTGSPDLAMLVPNRMFRNLGGRRFAEISGSSGTGHLQKGHAVACGDYDRDGDVDLFAQMGGATNGDRYHNVLFENPGQGNNWLRVKLVGKKTNRAAIGARVKVVTGGERPQTVHRHVTSGSSFGANPLEQHVGLGKAGRVARLEVHWPTSGTTQVFTDLAVNQAVEVTELSASYRRLPARGVAGQKSSGAGAARDAR